MYIDLAADDAYTHATVRILVGMLLGLLQLRRGARHPCNGAAQDVIFGVVGWRPWVAAFGLGLFFLQGQDSTLDLAHHLVITHTHMLGSLQPIQLGQCPCEASQAAAQGGGYEQ